MKVTKHGVATVFNNHVIERRWYPTELKARSQIFNYSKDYYRKYIGTKEIELYCSNCNKDLNIGDDYIKIDEDTRYCQNCYEENTITFYSVGGESVGDENDIEVYDDYDFEAEREELQ